MDTKNNDQTEGVGLLARSSCSAFLFEVPEQLSPRLAAEKLAVERAESCGIKTHYCASMIGEEWLAVALTEEDAGKSVMEAMAESCRLYDDAGRTAYGRTRNEAILALADQLGKDFFNQPNTELRNGREAANANQNKDV